MKTLEWWAHSSLLFVHNANVQIKQLHDLFDQEHGQCEL